MSVAKRLLLILSVVLCCAGCDRVSKSYAEARLPKTHALSFVAGSLRLQLSHNEGAFLSLGASLPKPWREAFFRAGVACVLAGLLVYAVCFAPASPWLVGGASLIFAGGASNLADRLLYDGYVVDFINIGIGSFRTGIFNIADVAITAGVVILLLGQRTAMQSISMSNGPGKGATHKKMRAGDPSGK
jgi:signal peptidase II